MKRMLAVVASAALLGACSVTKPPTEVPVDVPATWYAPPLAHQGSAKALTQWWNQFEDPVLTDWIARAQAQSPSVASARAQVFAARAARLGVEAETGPQAALVASAKKALSLKQKTKPAKGTKAPAKPRGGSIRNFCWPLP